MDTFFKRVKQKEIIQYYDRSARVISERYEKSDMNFLWNVLLEHFKGREKILEIGTGSGRDASFLMKNGFDVTGIDGSIAMIREAEQLHPELKGKIIHAVLPDEWPVFNEPFEAMYSIATLMHFSRDQLRLILRQCWKDLLPGAPVIISISGKRNSGEKERFFLEMSAEEWKATFSSTGCEVVSVLENPDLAGRNILWYTFLLKRKPV